MVGSAALVVLLLAAAAPRPSRSEDLWEVPAVRGAPDAGPERHRPELRYAGKERPLRPTVRGKYPHIFVGVSSYRDARCGATLFSAFTAASRPDKLYFGIVDQAHPKDESCLDNYCRRMREGKRQDPKVDEVWEWDSADRGDDQGKMRRVGKDSTGQRCPFRDHIKQVFVDFREAQGPSVARARQQELIGEDEQFCLQVDAHSSFAPEWDRGILQDWVKCENEYAVLSSRAAGVEGLRNDGTVEDISGHREVPYLCATGWSAADERIAVNQAGGVAWRLETPKLAALWGAGLSFSKCHAERNVPYDPHHVQIFDGEEVSRAARLWTAGYDIYTPTRPYVFHNESRSRGHEDDAGDLADQPWEKKAGLGDSVARLMSLWQPEGGPLRGGPYGLGSARSYAAWVAFSGVDPAQHVASTGQQCGNLRWVPYEVAPPHLYRHSAAARRKIDEQAATPPPEKTGKDVAGQILGWFAVVLLAYFAYVLVDSSGLLVRTQRSFKRWNEAKMV